MTVIEALQWACGALLLIALGVLALGPLARWMDRRG